MRLPQCHIGRARLLIRTAAHEVRILQALSKDQTMFDSAVREKLLRLGREFRVAPDGQRCRIHKVVRSENGGVSYEGARVCGGASRSIDNDSCRFILSALLRSRYAQSLRSYAE